MLQIGKFSKNGKSFVTDLQSKTTPDSIREIGLASFAHYSDLYSILGIEDLPEDTAKSLRKVDRNTATPANQTLINAIESDDITTLRAIAEKCKAPRLHSSYVLTVKLGKMDYVRLLIPQEVKSQEKTEKTEKAEKAKTAEKTGK